MYLLAQAAQSFASALMLPIIIFGIFYILVFLPMKRKQKKLEDLVSGLKPGDKVVTTGGIYGVIDKVKDNTISLKVSDQVKIEIAKTAVAGLQSPDSK